VAPTDAFLGITIHRFSPGVREMCCRQALGCGSFEVASEHLQRTAQLSLSEGTIRQMVEHQGRVVMADQRRGTLKPNFTADSPCPMDRKARRYGLSVAMDDPFDDHKLAGDVAHTTIGSLGLKVDQPFGYWFDFGDDWWHPTP
jgi:hypothetical protein